MRLLIELYPDKNGPERLREKVIELMSGDNQYLVDENGSELDIRSMEIVDE